MTTAAFVNNLLLSHFNPNYPMLQQPESTPSTDNETRQNQQEVLNLLNKETTANDIMEKCKIMAQAALDVDNAFDRSKTSILGFPVPFITSISDPWIKMGERWNARPGGLLSDSINLAIFATTQLDTYNKFLLQLVEDIKTEQDVKNAQAELRKFSTQQLPPDVNTDLVDRFKNLRNDVQEFEEHINNFLRPFGLVWSIDATSHPIIRQLQSDVEKLNRQINLALATPSAASPSSGLTKVFLATSDAGKLLQQRVEKQKNLDKALIQLKETNGREAGNLMMVSDRSYIALLCDHLATLATVWAEARFEAVDFANKLDGGLQVTGSAAFKLTLKIARQTAVVLKDGLRVYADILSSSLRAAEMLSKIEDPFKFGGWQYRHTCL